MKESTGSIRIDEDNFEFFELRLHPLCSSLVSVSLLLIVSSVLITVLARSLNVLLILVSEY